MYSYDRATNPAIGGFKRFCRFPLTPGERGVLLTRCVTRDPALWYMLFVPEQVRATPPVLVSVHGVSRNAIEHATGFAPWAETYGAVLVVPVFSAERYRDFQSISGRRNLARPDVALETILAEVERLLGIHAAPVRLFGYSAGAQFAHRFALARPERVLRLGLGAAGRYTFPDPDVKYPRGTARMERRVGMPAALEAFCRLPIRVWVGALDTLADAKLSRNARVVAQQGHHRVERGRRWVEAVEARAGEFGVQPDIAFHVVPEADHSFARCAGQGMVAEAARFLLED